jgi:hypothetical protein
MEVDGVLWYLAQAVTLDVPDRAFTKYVPVDWL